MKDLLIIYHNDDKEYATEVEKELNLLGVRTNSISISNIHDVNKILSADIKKYSSTLFYLAKHFSTQIINGSIMIKTNNKKIIFLTHNIKQKSVNILKKNIKRLLACKSKSAFQYALDVIKEIANEKRKIRLNYSNKIEDIWDSPLTIYQKNEGLKNIRDIIVDVTWSANPTRPEPAPALTKTLDKTFKHMKQKEPVNILDFGAGKLRHTVLLLETGHNVTAVEYPEIFYNPSETVKSFIKKAEKHKDRYGKIIYPNELVSSNKLYDLIMLINVVDIIPEPLERLFVLDQCNNKLKKGKYLLWFTQYGDTDQRNVISDYITDGGCTIKQARKTFYTEFDKETVDLMMALLGFERESITFDSGKNQAWLYKKIGQSLINVQKLALKLRKVIERKVNVGENNNTIIADVLDVESFVTLGDVLYHELSNIGSSKNDPYKYEKLMEQITKYIFKYNFKISDIKRQTPLHHGRIRIDISANWRENNNLKEVLDNYNLKSSFVPVECKNYEADIGNSELGQILTRHHKTHRHFGMILCRKIKNDLNKISDILHEFYNDHGFLVIVLDDEDIEILLKLQDKERLKPLWESHGLEDNKSGWMITEYIKKRIAEVLHHNKRRKSTDLYKEIMSI